jgi:hypothetical protein
VRKTQRLQLVLNASLVPTTQTQIRQVKLAVAHAMLDNTAKGMVFQNPLDFVWLDIIAKVVLNCQHLSMITPMTSAQAVTIA